MIKIIDICSKGRFPVIEFQFENPYTEAVLLNEFIVHVISSRTDKKPFLNFRYSVVDDLVGKNGSCRLGDLEIYVKNNGFGTAKDCYIEIDGPVLNEYYSPQERCFNAIDVKPGQEVKVCTFPSSKLFGCDITREMEMDGKWMGFSEDGDFVSDSDYITNGYCAAKLFIENGEFKMLTFCLQLSLPFEGNENCFFIKDNFEGTNARSFPIRKKINSGEIEKFHLMVGAKKSAFFEVSFEFRTVQGLSFKSKPIDIRIFNPSNLFSIENYIDKGLIDEKISDLKIDEQKNSGLIASLKRTLEEINNDEDYPFYQLYND